MAPTYIGDFALPGVQLRKQGLNRIGNMIPALLWTPFSALIGTPFSSLLGNMIIPNDNYCKFEDWVMPILDAMVVEQTPKSKKHEGTKWTPSSGDFSYLYFVLYLTLFVAVYCVHAFEHLPSLFCWHATQGFSRYVDIWICGYYLI